MENKNIDNSIISNIFKTIMIAMIISNLVEAVEPVIDGAPQFDDITMIGFKYFGKEGKG